MSLFALLAVLVGGLLAQTPPTPAEMVRGRKEPARVGTLEFRGPRYRVNFHLSLGNGRASTIDADFPTEFIRRLGIQEDMEMAIHLPADRIRVYLL